MTLRLPKSQSRDNGSGAEADMIYREQREERFRTKVAIQQFLNHNGPLFRAFAKAGTSINEVLDGDVLRIHASNAMKLAVLIAAEINKKSPEEVTAAEAKPFRTDAAEYVADLWLSNKPIDVEKSAKEMASAINLADKSWDFDSFKDDKMSDDASLMISAVSLAGSLSKLVDIYDFRLGKEKALGKVVNYVVRTASKMASDILPAEVRDADRRNVTQTLSRNLCSLMEACYERKAVEVATHLEGSKMTEAQKSKWLAETKPVDDILRSFSEWATCFGAFALAASQGMKSQDTPEKDNKTGL